MLKIQPGPMIDITTTQGYNNMGQPEVQVMVQGNYELIDMQSDLMLMKTQLNDLLAQQKREEELRKQNPALQQLYDQYKVVYTLVKTADDNVGNDGGG